MIDFEKAFNRINHNKLLTKLSDMGTPGWLLNVVKGFLEERSLVVMYQGEKSESKNMPGGGPQGTILGLFLFLVQMNDVGFQEEYPKLGELLTRAVNKRKEIPVKHWKYVDDLTLAEAIDLKKTLNKDNTNNYERPLNFHERTENKLDPVLSKVNKQMEDVVKYSIENEMKIN